jgi:hypothetical protein
MAKARDTKVKVIVDNEQYDFSSLEELIIDRDDLDNELVEQAAHYAFFRTLYERARMARLKIEAKMDEKENEIFLRVKDSGKDSGEKMTVDTVKAKVRTSPDLIKMIEKFQDAEYAERLLDSFVSALGQRKDTLIALARARNLEMSTPSAVEVERIKKNLLNR